MIVCGTDGGSRACKRSSDATPLIILHGCRNLSRRFTLPDSKTVHEYMKCAEDNGDTMRRTDGGSRACISSSRWQSANLCAAVTLACTVAAIRPAHSLLTFHHRAHDTT
jgi:hypothetical protein